MVRMPNIQARRSSLSSSTSESSFTAARIAASKTVATKQKFKRKNVNKILCCCSRDYACYSCSCCSESSCEKSLCPYIVNSIFRSFANKQRANMKTSTTNRKERPRRSRRRKLLLLLLESKIIGKSKTVGGNNNSSSRIINSTSTSSFSSAIVQPVNSQSTTYPLRFFLFQCQQSNGFDFEQFR